MPLVYHSIAKHVTQKQWNIEFIESWMMFQFVVAAYLCVEWWMPSERYSLDYVQYYSAYNNTLILYNSMDFTQYPIVKKLSLICVFLSTSIFMCGTHNAYIYETVLDKFSSPSYGKDLVLFLFSSQQHYHLHIYQVILGSGSEWIQLVLDEVK